MIGSVGHPPDPVTGSGGGTLGWMEAERAVARHRRWLDRLLPGRVVDVHVTGSTALGAYRPGRSDVDVVVVLDRRLSRADLVRLRVARLLASIPCAVSGVARRRWAFPGNVNGVYVVADDLSRPVAEIDPVASHTGTTFSVGSAFDVNPVMWTVLADAGVAVVRPPREETVAWCRENLATFWRGLAVRIRGGRVFRSRLAQEVLGVSRLWVTVTTGEVVSKEDAGDGALAAFDEEWHPLLHDALAWRRGRPADPVLADPRTRATRTAAWIAHVCDATLGPPPPNRRSDLPPGREI